MRNDSRNDVNGNREKLNLRNGVGRERSNDGGKGESDRVERDDDSGVVSDGEPNLP